MSTKRTAVQEKTIREALAELARCGFRPAFVDLGDFASVGVVATNGGVDELRTVGAVHQDGSLHAYIGKARKQTPGAFEALRRVPGYVVLSRGAKNLLADELAMLAGAAYERARSAGASVTEAATKAVQALFQAVERTAGTGDYRRAMNAGAAAYDEAGGTYDTAGYMAAERPPFRAFCVAALEYLDPNH